MSFDTRVDTTNEQLPGGPFLAKIISHVDPSYMGILEVQLLREVGSDPDQQGQLHYVRYMSPFYGVTSADHIGAEPNNYNNTQKSYGMWMIPPDVGSLVMVLFVQGDPKKGYWIGCVPDEGMNFMIPGNPSTKFVVGDSKKSEANRVPAAEYNKLLNTTVNEPTKYLKPAHPFEVTLDQQGLLLDDIRGITTSSARREVPSMVFGISTPGPVDKTAGAKQGRVGRPGDMTTSFVSRLGGSTFVMDDGDDKFLRKTKASDGPPEYAAVELGETTGLPNIPHNELVRLRTRTGHQILMHNSEDLIYIGNARGTAWIELTSDGKIDVFATDSVSIRTKADFNFYADRDINLEAGRNVNIKAINEMQLETGRNYTVVVGANGHITTADNLHVNTGKDNYFTAGTNTNILSGNGHLETAKRIDMNGTPATEADLAKHLKTHLLPDIEAPAGDLKEVRSITRRVPTPEPWPHHENLDPVKFKKDKTNRDVEGRFEGSGTSIKSPAEKWKQYSTAADTFEKLGEPNQG